MLEATKGGSPDRFVKQYEPFALMFDPIFVSNDPVSAPGAPNGKDDWGVTWSWPAGQPGAFPLHNPKELIVVKDIEHWRDYIKTWPRAKRSDAEWENVIAQAEGVNRSQQFVTAFVAPGIFEQTHDLCTVEETLIGLLEDSDSMADIIKFIAEKDLERAEAICEKIHPDALFHHDDWGSQLQTFMRPDTFEEFLLETYKQVYGYYKDHGVQVIVHHSDSYAATLVPYMIDMGIDIWQGPVKSNNLPRLIQEYGGQISFMGGLENGILDRADWTPEKIQNEVDALCAECGTKYFIPCLCAGSPFSAFEGVYDAVDRAIDACSNKYFGK